MKQLWPLVLLPAILGVAIRIAAELSWIDNYILSLRIDTGTLALLLGILLSGTLGVLVGIVLWRERQHQNRLNLMLDDAARQRRQFLGRLDHELKNPLTAIQAALANTRSEEDAQAVESIRAQTLRISRLVADLRKLAELESRLLERAPVDLEGVLRETVAIVQERPDSAGRSLFLSLPQAPWPLPNVLGDEDLLMLAFHNVMDNAIKFTLPGATVEVRTFEDAEMVVVEVADTGPGIPDDEIPYLWQELYRGKSARGVPGSGLGLALVRAIVELHDGQVGIRSRVDQGTVLAIRLPVASVTDL